MSSPFYGCVLNGVALAAVSVLGLVNPTLTEEIIGAVINSTPLQPFPADLTQGWVSVPHSRSCSCAWPHTRRPSHPSLQPFYARME